MLRKNKGRRWCIPGFVAGMLAVIVALVLIINVPAAEEQEILEDIPVLEEMQTAEAEKQDLTGRVVFLTPEKLEYLPYSDTDVETVPVGPTTAMGVVYGCAGGIAALGVAAAVCWAAARGGVKRFGKGVLAGILAAAAVAAVAFLVPSSPALVVDQVRTHFTIVPAELLPGIVSGDVDTYSEFVGPVLTSYGMWLAVATAIAILWTACRYRRQGRCFASGALLAVTCGAAALVCSHLLYCVVNWNFINNTLGTMVEENPLTPWKMMVQPWLGGYTMYGAVFGGILAALIWALVSRCPFSRVMDALIPGILVLILLGRFAETYTAQGLAADRVKEALHMLPFNTNMVDEWEYVTPVMQVFAYEAAAAGIALIAALEVRGNRAPAGRAAETGLAIVSAAQVMLDSWRNDELIKFGFVRLNMIMAAAVLAFILVTRIVRVSRRRGFRWWSLIRSLLFVVSAVAVIGVEFGLDGKFGITAANETLYALQAASVVVMCLSVVLQDGRSVKSEAPAADITVKA